jgi:REP element-mobilizing transposase RayT
MLQTATAFEWKCHAYCLMSTHFHLLLETKRELLSRGMHRLNGLYAQGFNKRYGRKGHLFEGRFSAYVIDRDDHFEEAYRYVIDNPVQAGLCAEPGDWPWTGKLIRSEGQSLLH